MRNFISFPLNEEVNAQQTRLLSFAEIPVFIYSQKHFFVPPKWKDVARSGLIFNHCQKWRAAAVQ
jgi:hypothetical protein